MPNIQKSTIFSIALCLSLVNLPAHAAPITVISFGGAGKQAQVKAFYTPFKQQTNTSVIAGEYNGEMANIKAMVDTHSVTWDVVEVESPELLSGCDEGLFEQLDPSMIKDASSFEKGTITPCGVGLHVSSYMMAYDSNRLKTPPQGWKDFWDVKKYPGKRGLRRGAKHNLEYALMADGVPSTDIYKVLATKEGQDRAFRKLDELKPYIQWWTAGAQPLQYLMAGDVVMSSAYNGRVAALRKDTGLRIVWNGGILDFDSWAIPKGSPNVAQAKEFIAFASRPEQQKVYTETLFYSPTNRKTFDLLDQELQSILPTAPQNMPGQIYLDSAFWADYGEQLEQRFNAWAAK